MDAGSAGPPSALAPGLASDGGLRPARPTLKKGGAVGFNAAPRIGDDAQARVDDFDEPLARGKPKGKKPTAAGDSADAALVWRAEGWRTKDKPHCELVVACRALEQSGADRAWLCKDGTPRPASTFQNMKASPRTTGKSDSEERKQIRRLLPICIGPPVPLESDEAVLHHARRSGSAARSRFVAVCVAGAATEAAAHRRHALQRAQMLKACASGSQGAAPGPLGAALFDAARLRTRETRLYAPTPGCMGGAAHAQKARSERQALYAIPSVNGNASVLCRPSDGDGAAPVADDAPRDEPVADDDADDAVSRRLKRPGRGVGRADVKARWRDVEQSAADLLSNCARADEGKRKDSAPTLAQVLDVFRQADELAAPTELYSGCDEHIRALQATLKELQAYVSDVRLLACRARDAVARAVRPEFRLAADDATGYGNYFYASKHAAASAAAADKPEAKEAVKTDSKKPESGKKPNGQKPNGRPRSSSDLRASNKAKPKPKKEVVEEEAEEEEEEDWPTAPKAPMKPPLDDAELVLKSLRAAAVFDEYTHASLSDAVRAARAWGKRADDALDRHATARELRGLADAAEATPFADEAKRLALDQRASEAHAFDCRVREALRRPATIPALVGLREAADGLVCFLETRETVNRLSDVGAAWQADADRVLRGSVPPARSTTLKLIAVADADFQVAGRHFAPLDFGQDVHFLKRKAREAEAWISRAAGCVASFEDCSDDCDEEALASLVGQAKTLPVQCRVPQARR